ncbi:MAG: transcriptional regulator [Rhodospirillaceae bacterium]|nr:MAG: transcriptional regulator [Rhodospirillaceae bacterium]
MAETKARESGHAFAGHMFGGVCIRDPPLTGGGGNATLVSCLCLVWPNSGSTTAPGYRMYFVQRGKTLIITLTAAALGDVARAKGMTDIARDTGLSWASLYKALSPEGCPELATVLRLLGIELRALFLTAVHRIRYRAFGGRSNVGTSRRCVPAPLPGRVASLTVMIRAGFSAAGPGDRGKSALLARRNPASGNAGFSSLFGSGR